DGPGESVHGHQVPPVARGQQPQRDREVLRARLSRGAGRDDGGPGVIRGGGPGVIRGGGPGVIRSPVRGALGMLGRSAHRGPPRMLRTGQARTGNAEGTAPMADWRRAARHGVYFGTSRKEMQIMTPASHDGRVVFAYPATA